MTTASNTNQIQLRPYQETAVSAVESSWSEGLNRPAVVIATGGGKGHPLDTEIVTPEGLRLWGDLNEGDLVYGSDGNPTCVESVYDRGVLPAYRVTFRDGTYADVDGDHLWSVDDAAHRGSSLTHRTVSTSDLVKYGLRHGRSYRWSIPVATTESPDVPLPIGPYTMGALIANGGLAHGHPVLTTPDMHVVDRVSAEHRTVRYTVDESKYCPRFGVDGVRAAVRVLGLDALSRDKFIPRLYLESGTGQRLALLQGLMDCDGGCREGRSSVNYFTTSPSLAKDVQELVNSLGGTASITSKPRVNPDNGRPYLDIELNILMPPGVSALSTPRKTPTTNPRRVFLPKRSIVSIEPAGDHFIRCIKVAAADNLYQVTRNRIVTHNTTIFSDLIRRNVPEMRKQGKRILVLAHRDTLLEQAEERIKLQNPGIRTAIVKGYRGQKTHQFADVVIASIQTLARPKRRESIDRIGLVIVDECHTAASKSYRDVLDHYGCMDDRATPTVGFTATLTRMNGGLPDVWQSTAYQLKIKSLIDMGYLVPPVARSVDVGLNLATTRVTAGDLNTGDIAAALTESAAFDTIADVWMRDASDRPTIAFMPNVETTERLRDAFRARGVAAESVVGSTPATERREHFAGLADGRVRVLTSCMTLTEGFDSPGVSCVIIGRPTLNPGLYIQMVGRGLRLAPGKTDCLVLDIAGASLKHSLAGVNDLESDCLSSCDCDCLSCGCSDRCKCGIRQCGCRCIEQHEPAAKACKCAGSEDCTCGCEGDPYETGDVHCICNLSDDCGCKGDGPAPEDKEVSAEVLRNLTELDILGAELAASSYGWLSTKAGVRFLPVGQDVCLFMLPDPNSDGFFQGRADGVTDTAPVTRLDDGALPASDARKAIEVYADRSGYTFNDPKARWRRASASQAQQGKLRRLGVPVPDGMTKGEASDAFASHEASRCLDRRFGHYCSQPSGTE